MSSKAKNIAAGNVIPTVATIAATWSAAQHAGAVTLWRFCEQLRLFVAGNPKITQTEIGVACAEACGRKTPYGKSWVSRAVKCANKFKSEPADEVEACRFMDMFHGIDNTKRVKKSGMTIEQARKMALSAARIALKLGDTADEFLQYLADELDKAEDKAETAKGKAA